MATDSTIEFLKQIARDPSLAAELGEAQSCEDFLKRAALIGQRIGHVPDSRRLQAAIDRRPAEAPQALEDSELENIGGGAWSAISLSNILQEVRLGGS